MFDCGSVLLLLLLILHFIYRAEHLLGYSKMVTVESHHRSHFCLKSKEKKSKLFFVIHII